MNRAKTAIQSHLRAIMQELEYLDEEPAAPKEVVREVVREEPQYYNARQAQRLLGIKQSTFYQWIREGRICHGHYLGPKSPRWTREELEAAFTRQMF